VKSLSTEAARRVAALIDGLTCFVSAYFFVSDQSYFLFGIVFFLLIVIYEWLLVAIFSRTLGMWLFGFEVHFRRQDKVAIDSLRRSLFYVWHWYLVFWPQDPEATELDAKSDGLVLYSWEHASGTRVIRSR